MNWVDGLIVLLVLSSAILGVIRGLLTELVALATWILAILASWLWSHQLANQFSFLIQNDTLRQIFAVALIIVSILIGGALLRYLLNGLVKITGLNVMNRLLGLLFGGVRGIIIVSIMINLLFSTTVARNIAWKTSILVPIFQYYSSEAKKIIINNRFINSYSYDL